MLVSEQKNMPERIRIALSGLTYICPAWSKDDNATEYTRTDLVPAWHDKPTCEGLWLRDMEAYDIALFCGQLAVHVIASWYEEISFGRWYGPIPEAPK